MADRDLSTYRAKRDFAATPEPAGGRPAAGGNRFVVHKHSATADHYDLRLEHNGVLLSWAVPKGPSLNPDDKRYAVQTEDHPLDYADFEGVIPEGEYGGGPMIVWDAGVWAPMDDVDKSLKSGAFKFRLAGEKLAGGWMLARLRKKPGEKQDKPGWILFKEHDPAADSTRDILVERPESVKSGRRIEDLVAPPPAPKPARHPRLDRIAGAVKAPMPTGLTPQLATAATDPPVRGEWLHEIKLDGYRTLAYLDKGVARLITRAGLDWTHRYGRLPEAFAALKCKSAILDGEIVALDAKGVSHFSLLQEALSSGAGDRLVFYGFDLLYLDGTDLRDAALADRKRALAALLQNGPAAIQYSDHFEGDASGLFEQVIDLGLEGIVSKRADSPYVGRRSESWLKIKAPRSGSYLVAGYVVSKATGGLASLALAEWVGSELVYRGKVGSGFDADTLSGLFDRLERLGGGGTPLAGAPKDIVWIEPVLRARVRYTTITREGSLRHAVFMGISDPEIGTNASTQPRQRLVSDADLATIFVTNPTRRLFGKSGATKLDIAVYYAAVGDFMLPHLFERPVSLLRCPSTRPADCFFQRHAFTGMPASMETVESTSSDGEEKAYIVITDTRAYLAMAQFGVVEFHAWGSTRAAIDRPDRIVFDLDPGEGIGWREMVEAAQHIKGVLERLGLVPFVKTSGGRGVHLVVPLTPKATWKHVHAATGAIAARLARDNPETFTATMGAANRKRRIFIDFHRNARSATAVAPYSLRARPGMAASTPLAWPDFESIDDPADLNYSSLPALLDTAGDPWANISDFARVLPDKLDLA